MNKKKIVLLMTSASMAIGGLFALVLLNQENNYSKTSADGSATFMLSDFSNPTVIDENTLEYQMPKMGSDTINVPIRVVGAHTTTDGVGSSSDFYFYNTEPFRGMSATGISFSSLGSYCFISYLSYNPLNLTDIYAGKYQDLYCSIGEGYGNDNFTVDTSKLSTLVNYRYFLCHIIPRTEGTAVNVNMLGIITPCAEEPTSVAVGTNTGVLSSEVKTYLDNTSNHCTTIPNEVGNGAYFTYISSYFGFHNVVAHNATNQFLTNLTTGFNLTYEADMYGAHQELYQKKVSDTTHTFSVQVFRATYGDIYEISYTDSIDYIDRSTTWPTSSINAVISSTYNGLVIPFSSSLIKDFITTSTSMYSFDKTVMIIANLTDGHTMADLKTDLIALRQSYVAAGLTLEDSEDDSSTFSFTLSYDNQIFGIMVGGAPNQAVVEFIIGEMEIKAFPTRTDIATKLELTTSTDKLVLFSGAGRFSWGNEHGGVVPYGATTMTIKGYDITSTDMNTFYASVEAAGYTLMNQDSGSGSGGATYVQKSYRYELNDLYGSFLVISTQLVSTGQASFSYTYYNNESALSEEVSFQEMMEHLNYSSDTAFVTEAVLPAEYTCKYLATYTTSYLVKGFVYGAGSEFINSLTSIDGVVYDYISDSYRLPGYRTALKIEQFEGVVVLTGVTAEYFEYPLESYTSFNDTVNQFIDDRGLTSNNAIQIAATDNVPAYFWIKGEEAAYFGTEAKVDELKALLTAQLESNTLFRYSSYLDAYVNEAGVTYSFSKQKYNSSNTIYVLNIHMEVGVTYIDYESYNDLYLGSNELLTHYPDFIPDKNLKAFHLEGSSPEYLKLTTNQSGIVDYALVLEANGFTFIEDADMYITVDPSTGAAYTVAIAQENQNKWSLTFNLYTYFQDSSYLAQAGNEEMSAYFAQFAVQSNFTSTSKIYNYMQMGNSGQMVVYNSPTEIANYKTFLTNNGYELNENINYYVKMSNDGNTIWGVGFQTIGSLTTIYFVVQEMTFVSHSNMMATLQTSSSYERNAAHLVYPVDDGYNHFFVESDSGRETTIMLNINYNPATYETAIMAHSEYLMKETGKEDGNDYTRYILANGTIQVINFQGMYYQVKLYCSYISTAGRTMDDAIVASLGDNPAELDGTYRYFVFTAPTDGVYSFTTYSDPSYDTYGSLFDSNKDLITKDDDSGMYNNFLIKYSLKENETVYIGAKMYSSGNYDMVLRISIKTMPDPSSVNALTRGTSNITLTKEETYFAYTPVHSGDYTLEFTGDYSVTIIIYDENFDEIDTFEGTTYLNTYLHSGVKYYFCVSISSKYDVSSYTYEMYFDCPSIPGDESTPVSVGTNNISISGVTSWYAFTPAEDGVYKIESAATGTDFDTYGYFYLPETGKHPSDLYTDDDSAGNGQFGFEIELEAGETYYIGAKIWGTDSPDLYNYSIVITRVS